MLYDLIVLSYHRFVEQESDYRFSRTYDQFCHDIVKKQYDWITIDDGMKCMIKACEILRHCNIRAKLFICTGLIGTGPGYCTWDELRELSKYHDIENHGHIHSDHSKMPLHSQYESIDTAQGLIIKNIGIPPRYFVPPYNQYNLDTEVALVNRRLTLVRDRITILNFSK